MQYPNGQAEQHHGKAIAEINRGSGIFPVQPHPVDLEPPFQPFDPDNVTDYDCFVNQWEGGWTTNLIGQITAGPRIFRPGQLLQLPESTWHNDYQDLVPIIVEQFAADDATPAKAEQLLRSLSCVTRPVSFEVIGLGENHTIELADPENGEIRVQFIAHRDDAQALYRQLTAHYPNSGILLGDVLTEADMFPAHTLREFGGAGATLALSQPYVWPLQLYNRLAGDPLAVAISAMENLEPHSFAILQILFAPTLSPFAQSVMAAVRDPYSSTLMFQDISESQLNNKFASPLFSVAVRIAAYEESSYLQLLGFAEQFACDLQSLEEKEGDEINNFTHAIGARCCYHPGILLNVEELAGLVHLPTEQVSSERLRKVQSRTRPAEPLQKKDGAIALGTNTHRGQQTPAGISAQLRPRHCYVAGRSGTGKSTLLENMIKQDIDAGHGVGVLDPHGDLVEHVLSFIPPERIKDVVYFNPTDTEHPPAFNIMATSHKHEREQLTGETIATIYNFYQQNWGVRINQYLSHAIPTILLFKDGTLADVRRLLTDANFRQRVLYDDQGRPRIKDHDLREFWESEFPAFGKSDHLPVLNKLSDFLLNKTLRNIICQKRSAFDFDGIINNRQIFLANLSKGLLTDRIAGVLGTFIVSKMVAATFRRAAINEEDRIPFYLYIDEFQNFMGTSVGFEQILSEARKYKLILTVANQYVSQLSPEVKAAIFGNVGSLLTFQLGVSDANQVAAEFGDFTSDEILSLERGQAIARVGGSQATFNLATPPPPKPLHNAASIERIIQLSRDKYTKGRSDVEREIQKRSGKKTPPDAKQPKPTSARDTLPPKTKKPQTEPEFIKPADFDDDLVY